MLTSSPGTRPPQLDREDAAKWVVVLALVFAGLMAMAITRQLVSPLDDLLTNRVCSAYGEEIGRGVISYERSHKLALTGRTAGSCLYGPVEGATDNLQVSIPDVNPGRFYGASKVLLFILQLGAASLVVRLLADPLLDRFVRDPEPEDELGQI